MALKDGAGLVKIRDGKYPEIPECCHRRYSIGMPGRLCETPEYQWNYLLENESDFKTVTGTIQRIAQSVIDGNSYFYLVLNGHSEIFDVPVQDYLQVVTLQEGDTVTVEYLEGTPVCMVLNLERNFSWQQKSFMI